MRKTKIWFDGLGTHYIPLNLVLVITIPFLLMLLISTEKWETNEAQFKDATKTLQQVVPAMEERIAIIRKQIDHDRSELWRQRVLMERGPEVFFPYIMVKRNHLRRRGE